MATLPNGLRVECDLRDHVQRHIYFMGAYEPIESHLFSRMIRRGWTVFDVGSNVGQYALLASTLVGETGSVHAFEPVPGNFERARHHLVLNQLQNVSLHRIAAWRESKNVELGLAAEHVDNDGAYSVGSASSSAVAPVNAQALALDDYVDQRQIARVDLIKMDIEGAELAALQGLVRTLRRHRPVILIEINRRACVRMGYEPVEILELLVGELEYRAWQIGHSAQAWVPLVDPTRIEQTNCLFTPGDLAPELTNTWDYRYCIAWAGSAGRGDEYLPMRA
jgi:FkbM family methyltransferase